MDPRYTAQEILLCDLCQRAALQNHCELCQINLCKACVGEHLSDPSKRHNVVPYKQRISMPNNPKCPRHNQKHCELHCEECDIPVCSTCISSGKHKGHDLSDALQKVRSKTKQIHEDLKELEIKIYPTYENIILDVKTDQVDLEKHYKKLTTAVTRQGEDWHRDIDIIVNEQKSKIDKLKTEHQAVLSKKENEIKQIISNVKQSILDLKKILDSSDVSLISAYKPRNAEFRSLPPKVNVPLPNFSSHQINTEQLNQMFGSLSALSITTEYGYVMKTPLLDEPELITTLDSGHRYLYSVFCLRDEEKIWTCGNDNIMKMYNLQGKLLLSIQTISRRYPRDITVHWNGDLVYTDPDSRTVNIVKNMRLLKVIRLHGWKPYYVFCTSSGDLLVTMVSDSGEQAKVVRYFDSIEKQTLQFDNKGKPLYSPGDTKYISENRNLDICVADYQARAVVVVKQAGKLRFRYTGLHSTSKVGFYPKGITTDSQSQILIADTDNNCIHILRQDGQFLRYIDQYTPWGLSVDSRDNLFVAEWDGGQVKKIKYM